MPQSRQLAAIMFTDIVGYTAIMGKDSAKALELVRISKEIQKPLVEKHNGQWLKEMGDGALAKFGTALDAVNCAIDIQRASRADFEGNLRIGIHLGDITVAENDVYGDGVNIASRIQSIADPGGVYISESIEKAIRGQSEVQAKYLGELKLKNVDYDVRTYAVQGVGLPVPDVKDDKELSGHLWAEIQRRGIIRAILSYLIVSALLVLLWNQVQQLGLELPRWSFTLLITVLGLSLPLSLYLAWNYERSPQGFVRTTSEASWQNPLKGKQRKPLTGTLFLIGLVLIGFLLYIYAGEGNQNPLQERVEQSSASTAGDLSIAVLPFKDDSPDADNQYFCDGMMEEILNHLQKIGELGVKSRTDVEPYRNSNLALKTIAAELGVAYILEGSVRKYGNQFRVTTQLIDVKTGNHLWSDTYDGILSDTIFVIQTNISKEIAAALDVLITPEEEVEINKFPTNSVEAYEQQIKGKHELEDYWVTANHEYLIAARDFLNEALNKDPEYLAAIKTLAMTFIAEENYDSALYYSEKLVTIDPQNSSGYISKAECYYFMGKLDLAIENYSTAMELSQFDSQVDEFWTPVALGRALVAKGDALTGLPYMAEGLKMLKGIVPAVYTTIADAFNDIGDYDRANRYYQLSASKNACKGIFGHVLMFRAQHKIQQALEVIDTGCNQQSCERPCTTLRFLLSLQMEEFDKSEQYFSQLELDEEAMRFSYLRIAMGYVYYKLGRIDDSNKILNDEIQKLESLDYKNKRDYLGLSQIYAIKGDQGKAIEYLSEYAKRHFSFGWHDFILIDPLFENLREDPQFKAIVQKAQEEKAALRTQVNEMIAQGELDL